jgi:glycosyltransferase involved in cell wall biosynthesis
MKLLIWTPMPTHHQSAFFCALRTDRIDLVVHYYMSVPSDRLKLGWSDPVDLPAGERRVPARIASVGLCADWRERIHILPGCGRPSLFGLALFCPLRGLTWLHWSEASNPNSKWRSLTNALRRCYAILINRFGSGALAMGDMARRDFISWGIRPDLIRFLPYSIPPICSSISDSCRPACPSNVRFLFLGYLNARKAVDVLLVAFARVATKYPDASLSLVGLDQSQGEYQRLARSLGIGGQSRFLGPVAAESIGRVLSNHDVLVLPSRFDGWGMVLSEAASMGLALIASDTCGAAYHLIDNGKAGYVVQKDDEQSLADAMICYCRAPETVSLHGARSRALFADLIPRKNSARLQAAIRELCYRERVEKKLS